MEIPFMIMKFKFHIIFAAALSLILYYLIYLAPRFLDVLVYFWPLLASTAMFLVAVLVFGRISAPVIEAPGDKTGESILDYVSSSTEEVIETYKPDRSEESSYSLTEDDGYKSEKHM